MHGKFHMKSVFDLKYCVKRIVIMHCIWKVMQWNLGNFKMKIMILLEFLYLLKEAVLKPLTFSDGVCVHV